MDRAGRGLYIDLSYLRRVHKALSQALTNGGQATSVYVTNTQNIGGGRMLGWRSGQRFNF